MGSLWKRLVCDSTFVQFSGKKFGHKILKHLRDQLSVPFLELEERQERFNISFFRC
jgi:hypothetical protein